MRKDARRLVAAALLLLGMQAFADCAVNRPIRVAYFDLGIDYDPDSKGGRDVDLINELGRRSGCRFEAVYDSRVRIWKQLEDGSLDMSVSALDTPDRDSFARFVLVSWTHDQVLVHLKPGFPVTAGEFLADHSLTVGTVKGYRYTPGVDEWVTTLRAQNRTYEAPDLTTLMRVFDAGRVSAIPVEIEVLPEIGRRYHLNMPYQRTDWFAKNPKTGNNLALSRSRLPESLSLQFHDLIEHMRQDGSLQRIAEKYVPAGFAMQMLSPE
jgi:polar amino acid transport system substrate-binding protein